jgi:hypothetical protein
LVRKRRTAPRDMRVVLSSWSIMEPVEGVEDMLESSWSLLDAAQCWRKMFGQRLEATGRE